MKNLQYIVIIFSYMFATNLCAQSGYQIDSLQIKVYTEIEYVNQSVKNLKVNKVFCDYCTEFQTEQIKEEALRRAYLVRNDQENKLINGKKKLALYIRISKKDFSEMKEENNNN